MSGPSTLRICLAAMAPALTEAASARLRLQDPSDSERKPSVKPFHDSKTVDISIPRTIPIASDDLKVLGGRKRSKGEGRVTHLSLAAGERDTLELDPPAQVSTFNYRANGNFQNLSEKPTVPRIPNAKITRFETTAVKSNVESPYYVSEDFQESSIISQTTASLLKNLKIMNKPDIGTDLSQIEKDKGTFCGCSESEGLLVDNVGSKFKPRMVNGNNAVRRGGNENSGNKFDEKGDAPPKRTPSSVIKRTVQFTDLEDKALLRTSEKMGVACTGKGLTPQPSVEISTTVSSLQQQSMVMIDGKTRDEIRKECTRKQAQLERKVETLLRRLKRMRGKVVETHSREQLRQFVSFQHRSLQQVAKVMRSEAPGPAELKEHFLSNEEVKSMSTTELVKLVKTYQPLATSNASSAHHRSLASSRGSGISSGLVRFGGNHFGSSVPMVVMEPALRAQCADVSERLSQRVVTVSAELDSDATASSSGGESGDEEAASSSRPTSTEGAGSRLKLASADLPPLLKRAEWRWAADRAGIVSRWTWLQAQVSDLEYRIRQQSQVHRQLRASKGGVVLGDPPSTTDILRRLHGLAPNAPHAKASGLDVGDGEKSSSEDRGLEVSPCNIQAVMSNVDKQASRLTQSLGNCLSPASSTASGRTSIVGSPRVTSSTSSPCRSPALAGNKDSSSVGNPNNPNSTANASDLSPNVPTELSLASRTSDLLHTPELQKQQQNPPSTLLSSSSSSSTPYLDATCQSARCRPLCSYRKRRILRTIGLHRHSHKAARLSDVRCRCFPPANSCPMCGGRQNNTVAMDTETMALRERVALVDASFHPVLSFPEDTALPVHCEGLLKSGMWQNKPTAKRSRGSHQHQHHFRTGLLLAGDYHLHNKRHLNNNGRNNNHHHQHQGKVLTLVTANTGQGQVSKNRSKKNGVTTNGARQSVKNSTTTASVIKNFSEKIKNKYESKAKSKTSNTKVKSLTPRNKVKRKASKLSKGTMKKKKQTEAEEEEEDLEAMYLEQELGDIDGREGECGGGGSLSASASQSSLKDANHQHHRGSRRKVDNSYDINNIVIPLSMATSVPVEQPQYKEIVTPKWREVPVPELSASVTDGFLDSLATKLEKTNGVARSLDQHKPAELDTGSQVQAESPVREEGKQDDAEEEEEEDLSDERFALRHLQLELEEKKRFRNFVQYPPLRRSRARSDVSLGSLDSSKFVDGRGDAGLVSEENSMSSRPTTPVLMKSLPSLSGREGSSLEESLATLQQGLRPRTMSVSSTPTPRRDTRTGSLAGNSDGLESVQESAGVKVLEPWPRRTFPLAVEEYESMLEAVGPQPVQRSIHQHETRFATANVAPKRVSESIDREITGDILRQTTNASLEADVQGIMDGIAPLSPQSVSASASISSTAEDDPADTEWTGGDLDADGGLSSDSLITSGSGSYKRGRNRRILDDPNDPEWFGSDTPRKNKNKR